MREFLKEFPEMKLLKEEKLYPHRVRGEGHFAALFERTAGGEVPKVRQMKPSVSKGGEKAYREFEKSFFKEKFADDLHEANGCLYALPKGVFDWRGIGVLRVGVRLGEMVNGRFEPSHSLVMAAKKEEIRRTLDLSIDDPRLDKFLAGETIEWDGEKGWCAVCAKGFPIGLGKAVNGVVKNHIPKGLRKMGR